MSDTKFDSEQWGAKLKVLKENLEHHAIEEEEGKMVPKVKREFSADEIEELGARMLELKEAELARADERQAATR